MKIHRISIAGLMGFIILVAVGTAAMKKASEMVASVTFTFLLGILLVSLLGVAFRRGDKQLFWAGFSTFGWGYLVLALSTGVLKPPELLSSHLIAHLSYYMNPPAPAGFNLNGSNYRLTSFTVASASGFAFNAAWPFAQIGHSIITLLIALLGTVLARIFARPED